MKWEYKPRKIESIEQMNEYGQEGWELVAVSGDIAYYKRLADKQIEKQQMAAETQRMAKK
jgi:predicted N-acetyltransferase YhbS